MNLFYYIEIVNYFWLSYSVRYVNISILRLWYWYRMIVIMGEVMDEFDNKKVIKVKNLNFVLIKFMLEWRLIKLF